MAKWWVDSIGGQPLPVLFVRGWCTDPSAVDVKLEYIDGTLSAPALLCREMRPDVASIHKLSFGWPGFIAEFHLTGKPGSVRMFGKTVPIPDADRYATAQPHYHGLYQTDRVLHRDDIYCVGLPASVDPAIVQLADALLGTTILDFGCGNGDLVTKLRALNREASGIEIDRPEIRAHLRAEAQPFVKLYDGGLPLPYSDRAFDSAVATEVIEHVGDPQAVADELMRIAKASLFVTVPDMSSVPFSWPTNTVPWHLLEASHVNFFNARSLSALFHPRFVPSKQFRLFNYTVGPHFIPGSIGILFTLA